MRIKIIIAVAILLILMSYGFNKFFTENMVSGTYVSNNRTHIADGPNFGDTLILYKDNRFDSQTWGVGQYALEYSGKGTKLALKYKYAFGMAGYTMYIKRHFYGNPRILIDSDLEYYFNKIE